MHKSLLIHHENTSDKIKELFTNENIIDFDYSIKHNTLDDYISKEIIGNIKSIDFDIVYIKDNLSSNYLELYGLIVAYHIRLSEELKEKSFVPIVFLSDIDKGLLNQVEPLARILFTANIYLESNSIKTIEKFNKKNISIVNKNDFEVYFLNLIEIKPPENSSNHDITNEWAIDQWASSLNVNPDTIKNNRSKISSMLYYKYLKRIFHLQDNPANNHSEPDKYNGKILFIDDKCNDGWGDIIKKFSEIHYTNVDIEVFDYEYKNAIFKDMSESVVKKIETYNPDMLILDLRLLADDNSRHIDKISGVKLLEIIKDKQGKKDKKGKYPYMQIIAFTASNNSKILDRLHESNILGYVKKDSPSDLYIASKNNSLDKLESLIIKGLKKKYIKEIWELQNSVIEQEFLSKKRSSSDKNKIIINKLDESIKSVFDIMNSNMPNAPLYAMLAIYKSIELINDYFFNKSSFHEKKTSWKDGSSEEIDDNTQNKIKNIISRKTNIEDERIIDDIKNIHKIRNNFIHPEHRGTQNQEIKSDDIIQWFKMLNKIISSIHLEK